MNKKAFIIKMHPTHIFSNEIPLILNDTPWRNPNSTDLSQVWWGTAFQCIPHMLGHS